MLMNNFRYLRKIAALVGIVTILFSQLAVATYACPDPMFISNDKSMSGYEQTDSSNIHCAGKKTDNLNLCKQHCQRNQQSFNHSSPLSVAPIIVSYYYSLSLGSASSTLAAATYEKTFLSWLATAPPLTIRNCCFRI